MTPVRPLPFKWPAAAFGRTDPRGWRLPHESSAMRFTTCGGSVGEMEVSRAERTYESLLTYSLTHLLTYSLMIVRIGYIPYLNMAPFHRGFGPQPFEAEGHQFNFNSDVSRRHAGAQRLKKGSWMQGRCRSSIISGCPERMRLLGSYGIGLKRCEAAERLLFSKSRCPRWVASVPSRMKPRLPIGSCRCF